jgi:predicted dehydrogenase
MNYHGTPTGRTLMTIRFGIIGLGLMGKEFASAAARWCHLTGAIPKPEITAICNRENEQDRQWFTSNFTGIQLVTGDYHELIHSDVVDAVYCAVPHHLHQQVYVDILRAGKHLLAEKPFGIDLAANTAILEEAAKHPDLVVTCSSEFPYYPGAKRIVSWINRGGPGRIMEVRCGFHHSSDMDLKKPINWKRMIQFNGEYGCMGDLGFHVHHIPLRVGWRPVSVYAALQNIAKIRPGADGDIVPCETWDNATLLCKAVDAGGEEFVMSFETKRMAPGQTNTWFVEVYGTEGSARFSTHDPRAFYQLESSGREQGWTRTDIGADFYFPSITGGIFETGFSDAFQQMIAGYLWEFGEGSEENPFPNGSMAETAMSHQILTAALESHKLHAAVDPRQYRR